MTSYLMQGHWEPDAYSRGREWEALDAPYGLTWITLKNPFENGGVPAQVQPAHCHRDTIILKQWGSVDGGATGNNEVSPTPRMCLTISFSVLRFMTVQTNSDSYSSDGTGSIRPPALRLL